MIPRLFVLLLVSIIFVGGFASFRPAQSASSDPCKQDHAALADTSLGENGEHKTGHDAMGPPPCFQTEEGVRPMFRKEGGPPTGLRETFVSQDCPYFKIDVEFKPVGIPNQDVIVKVSKPYVQFATTN